MEKSKPVENSIRRVPYISDTVVVLSELRNQRAGVYLIDSIEKWDFYEICCALNERHGSRWIVHSNDDFIFDQYLIDARLKVPSLNSRLKSLP
jgi:dTDP-4-dehydrorhamnose reductase